MEEPATANQPSARVVKICVEALFGLYDHNIPLNESGRITIIHGPNGVGKTVLLKSITAFFKGNYFALTSTPFKVLNIWLSDGNRARIERSPVPDAPRKLNSLRITVYHQEGLLNSTDYVVDLPEDFTRYAATLARHIPWLDQVGPEEFFDSRTQAYLEPEEVISKYASHPASPPVLRKRFQDLEPKEIKAFRNSVNVQIIETNRLYRIGPSEYAPDRTSQLRDRITDYADQLRDRVQQTLAAYGRNAQKLDQTFPHRLISEPIVPLGVESLKVELNALDDTQKALAEFGLLERIATIPLSDDGSGIEQSKIVALTLFASDIKEKLKVLEPLSNRLRIFLDSVNGKLRNKKIHINKEHGISARDTLGSPLLLEHLSSGEQHEIVLIFDLVFNIPKGSLVLLDEPELSLHVTWQKMFLPELMKIADEAQFDCIVATHSPFIVGPRSDLMVLLDADPDVDLPIDGSADSIPLDDRG